MFEMERQSFTEQADADKLTLQELRERLETLSFENEQLKKETDDQIKTLQREKEELAEISGVPVRTIENIEKRGQGTIANAIKLADALGVSLDELCRDKAGE